MTDLLTSLRTTPNVQIPDSTAVMLMRATMREAADEIERLEREVASTKLLNQSRSLHDKKHHDDNMP